MWLTRLAADRDSRRNASRVVLEVSRGGRTGSWDESERDELLAAARFHRVAPLVHIAARQVCPSVASALEVDRMQAVAMHLQACEALRQLSAELADIDWVTFKGPVFSEHAHPAPGLRTYHDVDVLVAPAALRDATRRLTLAGWQVADYQDMLRNPDTPGEMHWLSPRGVLVDLHWSMINMAPRRRRFSVSTEKLLRHRVRIPLGPLQVWTLDPSDSLVHACLHAALSGADKLLLLVDVDHLTKRVVDWDEVASRARAWRAQAQVSLVLGRARHFLGTPLPSDLDRQLGISGGAKALMSLTNRVAPVPSGREHTGIAKFVARAVEPSTASTLGTVGRHAVHGIRDRALGGTLPAEDRQPASQAALESYLSAVESATSLGPF